MGRKAVKLQEDENLAIEVRKYPFLYDKSCPAYNDKRLKLNAWKRIKEELGMEEGEAQEKFRNLKARYSRRKTAVKNAKKSGTEGSNELVSAETALSSYNFVKWLDPFMSGTTQSFTMLDTNTNTEDAEYYELNDESENDGADSEKNNVDDYIEREKYDSDNYIEREELRSDTENTQEYLKEKSPVMTFKIEKPKPQLRKIPDEIPSFKKAKLSGDELLTNISKRLQEKQREKRDSPKDTEDAEDIFGKMVAQKLRSLSAKRKIKLEFEINSAIFKYVSEEQEEKDAIERAHALYQPPQIQILEENFSPTGSSSSYYSNQSSFSTVSSTDNKTRPESSFQFSYNNMNRSVNNNSTYKQS